MYATPKNKPRRIVESRRPGPGMPAKQFHLYTVQGWPMEEVLEMIRLLKRHETALAAVPDNRAESLRKKCKKEADRFWLRVEMTKPRIQKRVRAPRNTSSQLNEPIKEYIGRVINLDKQTIRLIKHDPVEKWPKFYLEMFLKESTAIGSLIKQATGRAQILGIPNVKV